jgi:hypothetical protein
MTSRSQTNGLKSTEFQSPKLLTKFLSESMNHRYEIEGITSFLSAPPDFPRHFPFI